MTRRSLFCRLLGLLGLSAVSRTPTFQSPTEAILYTYGSWMCFVRQAERRLRKRSPEDIFPK
jgi:hypothetical protein